MSKKASSKERVSPLSFFSEAKEELRKVSRPTRQETIQATMVTLFIVAFVSIMLSLFDFVFNQIMAAVI